MSISLSICDASELSTQQQERCCSGPSFQAAALLMLAILPASSPAHRGELLAGRILHSLGRAVCNSESKSCSES